MKITARATITIAALLVSIAAFSQNTNDAKDPLKEFDPNSFAEAGTKVKDSTVLYQHLIGVKWGYAKSNVAFSQSSKHKGFNSADNFGIYYTYFHSMLGNMPFFGIQIGLEKSQWGYTHVTEISENVFDEAEQRYSGLVFPFMAMFRYDISRIRFMLGAGGYGVYIYDTELPDGMPQTTNELGFGLMGEGGIAIKFLPVEVHLTASYKYGLTHFLDPKIYSQDYWLYTHPTQFQISVGLHYNFGGKYYKRK